MPTAKKPITLNLWLTTEDVNRIYRDFCLQDKPKSGTTMMQRLITYVYAWARNGG